MVKKIRQKSFNLEFALSVLLLISFFRPWLYSLGAPVAAYQIRDHLEGPSKLVSFFSKNSDLVRDYNLSWCIYFMPGFTVLTLVLILAKMYHSIVGLITGAAAIVAFLFLRHELPKFPFHHLVSGSYLALGLGIALVSISLLRLR